MTKDPPPLFHGSFVLLPLSFFRRLWNWLTKAPYGGREGNVSLRISDAMTLFHQRKSILHLTTYGHAFFQTAVSSGRTRHTVGLYRQPGGSRVLKARNGVVKWGSDLGLICSSDVWGPSIIQLKFILKSYDMIYVAISANFEQKQGKFHFWLEILLK